MLIMNAASNSLLCPKCQITELQCLNCLDNSDSDSSYDFLYDEDDCDCAQNAKDKKVAPKKELTECKNIHIGNVINIHIPNALKESQTSTKHDPVKNQTVPPDNYGELNIVTRHNWKALPPMKAPIPLSTPAKFVIICHTESEAEENTQTENIRLLRSIQKYHFRKRSFNDISYNFLIGSDGNVYEGRGWNVQGEFARKYNKVAIGISFVGYYEEKLPSEECLVQARALIRHGVKIGAIEENYGLLAHCQSIPTDSPGDRLYFEIQRWNNWDRSIDVHHPSPLVATN